MAIFRKAEMFVASSAVRFFKGVRVGPIVGATVEYGHWPETEEFEDNKLAANVVDVPVGFWRSYMRVMPDEFMPVKYSLRFRLLPCQLRRRRRRALLAMFWAALFNFRRLAPCSALRLVR